MNTQSYLNMAVVTASIFLLMGAWNEVDARGGGGSGFSRGGGGGGGGFSRQGAASSGSFSSRAGSRPGSMNAGNPAASASRTASRSQAAQTASTGQGETRQNRQQASNENVQDRQEGRTDRTGERQEGYTERTQARQDTLESHEGYYGPPGGYHYDDDNWDGGEVAIVAIGAAAVGAMAASSQNPQDSTVVYSELPPTGSAGLPCTPNTAVVNGVTYYQCGTSWYTQAYGNGGVIYMPVPPPN